VFVEALREAVTGICALTDRQAEQLRKHYDLLRRWNEVLNLSAVRNEAEIVERHYAESLFLASQLPSGELRIADIGSGAGFPGFPVAVLRPDCAVTLVESHQRKAVFLREAARETPNVRVIASRAEMVKERFDWAISRAVRYADIHETLVHLASNVALLTGDTTEEELPGFTWKPPIRLPWGKHRLLFVSRETPTVIA
jgi:16S rRNA (guanine527-N7)-methyltransferase